MLFAIPAAISGTLGLYAYYRGMAVGAMSIVAPIAGVSAVVPVALRNRDRRPAVALAVARDRWPRSAGSSWRRESRAASGKVAAGVGLALLAAIGFGGYFPPMHAAGQAPTSGGRRSIFRMTSTSVILAAVAIRRPSLAVQPIQVPLLALIGIGDMLGNLLFAAASTSGLVSITSVLASLYPIVTVMLARVVLQERVARSQEAGIVLALAGVRADLRQG